MFQYEIIHPYLNKINPEEDFVDVEVILDNKKYRGSVTTIKFIEERMEYYKLTGENSEGSYFCAKGMVVVERIDNETIKKTIDDLIKRGDLGIYFLD